MFRLIIGSSSGPPEIQIQKLPALFVRYGIPHAYRVTSIITGYMSFFFYSSCCGNPLGMPQQLLYKKKLMYHVIIVVTL